MVTLNNPIRPRRAFARAVTTANNPKGTNMNSETATRAHRVITAALGATWYRDNADDALSVANLPTGGTVVIERTTYALSGNVEVQVTLQLPFDSARNFHGQLPNGDVWALATWDDDADAYAMLADALAFVARHAPTARRIRGGDGMTATTLTRETLREFLSRHAAPGADFPTGARMQAAGAHHGEADTLDCGYDYTHGYVAHAIAEWVTLRDARAYLTGYRQGRAHADALAATIRAGNAADALRAARNAMTRDGGDETAPTWSAYLAALANHDAATAALTATAEADDDDDDDDYPGDDACGVCNGEGYIASIAPNTGPYITCPSCHGAGTN